MPADSDRLVIVKECDWLFAAQAGWLSGWLWFMLCPACLLSVALHVSECESVLLVRVSCQASPLPAWLLRSCLLTRR